MMCWQQKFNPSSGFPIHKRIPDMAVIVLADQQAQCWL